VINKKYVLLGLKYVLLGFLVGAIICIGIIGMPVAWEETEANAIWVGCNYSKNEDLIKAEYYEVDYPDYNANYHPANSFPEPCEWGWIYYPELMSVEKFKADCLSGELLKNRDTNHCMAVPINPNEPKKVK
jgi:hypothetical protein